MAFKMKGKGKPVSLIRGEKKVDASTGKTKKVLVERPIPEKKEEKEDKSGE